MKRNNGKKNSLPTISFPRQLKVQLIKPLHPHVSLKSVHTLYPLFYSLHLYSLYETTGKNLEEIFSKCENPKDVAIFKLFISRGWLKRYKTDPETCLTEFNTYITKKLGTKTPSPKNLFRGVQNTETVTKQFTYENKFVYTFGINDYTKWTPLKNACHDSLSVLESFKKYNFKGENYQNSQVTKSSIEELFKNKLSKQAKPNDLVVISFHMHGHSDRVNRQPRGFIVPIDAQKPAMLHELVCITELISWLSYIQCRHVLLLFDCCFSGFSVVRSNQRRSSVMLRQPCRVAINAGTHQQTVMDGGWGKNSVFTGALIDILNNCHKEITITEIYSRIASKVTQIAEQTPTMGRLPGDMGGEIYLKL